MVCRIGVSYEGPYSSITFGLSNDGKWVFNKACSMPCCHAVVHFELKTSRFLAMFQEDGPDRGGTSQKQAVFPER